MGLCFLHATPGGVELTLQDPSFAAETLRPGLDFVELMDAKGKVSVHLVAALLEVAPLRLRVAVGGGAMPPGPWVSCRVGEPQRCYEGFVAMGSALAFATATSVEARCEVTVRSVVGGEPERVSQKAEQRLIRARRVWPVDAPVPKLVVVSDRAAAPDAGGRCGYTLHWEVPAGAEGCRVRVEVASEAELLLAEARWQPRPAGDFTAKGTLTASLAEAVGVALPAAKSDEPLTLAGLLWAVQLRLAAIGAAAKLPLVVVPAGNGAKVPLVAARAEMAELRAGAGAHAGDVEYFGTMRALATAIARAELALSEGMAQSKPEEYPSAARPFLPSGSHSAFGWTATLRAIAWLHANGGAWRMAAEVPCAADFARAKDRRGPSDPADYVAQGDRRSWTVEGLPASVQPGAAVARWCVVGADGQVKATRVVVVGVPADPRLVVKPRVVAVFQGRLGADGISRIADAGAVTVEWVQDVGATGNGWQLSCRGLSMWALAPSSVQALGAGPGQGQRFSATVEGTNGPALAALLAGPVVVTAASAGCEGA